MRSKNARSCFDAFVAAAAAAGFSGAGDDDDDEEERRGSANTKWPVKRGEIAVH